MVVTAGVAATSLGEVDELRSAAGSSLSLLTPSCTLPDLQGRRIFGLRALWGFAAITSVRGVMTVTPHHHIPVLHLAEKSVLLRYKLPPRGALDTATPPLSIALLYRAIHACLCTQVYDAVNIAWGGGGSNLPTITKAGHLVYFCMKACSFCHTYLHSVGKSYAFFPYTTILY